MECSCGGESALRGFDNTFAIESAAELGADWRAVAAVGADDLDPVGTIERAAAAGASGARLFSLWAPSADAREPGPCLPHHGTVFPSWLKK